MLGGKFLVSEEVLDNKILCLSMSLVKWFEEKVRWQWASVWKSCMVSDHKMLLPRKCSDIKFCYLEPFLAVKATYLVSQKVLSHKDLVSKKMLRGKSLVTLVILDYKNLCLSMSLGTMVMQTAAEQQHPCCRAWTSHALCRGVRSSCGGMLYHKYHWPCSNSAMSWWTYINLGLSSCSSIPPDHQDLPNLYWWHMMASLTKWECITYIIRINTQKGVTDPELLREGVPAPKWGTTAIWLIFAPNYIQIKKC